MLANIMISLVCYDLRVMSSPDKFDGVDVFDILKNREVPVDESLRVNLKYIRTMPNGVGVIKSPRGTGKTWFDVTVALLLIYLSKKVKVWSPSNKSARTPF